MTCASKEGSAVKSGMENAMSPKVFKSFSQVDLSEVRVGMSPVVKEDL